MGATTSQPGSFSERTLSVSGLPTSGREQTRNFYIGDNFNTLDQVTDALRKAGVESSNLIVGIDFTKSNEWTGNKSFNGKSLHSLSTNIPNPYEQAISIIGRTLSSFDEDNLIPCFGFGDVTTHDQNVFSFFPDHHPCNGLEAALLRYKALVPHVKLAGPTSFAPIIGAAIDIVVKSNCQYHVLLIIADGQVTRSADTESGWPSPQERNTIDAIVAASRFPLSIVLVGVGDGPWDTMWEFDDNIPHRAFDNFQFVNFTEIMLASMPSEQKEATFALKALMEIPTQFKACVELNLLNRQESERVATLSPLPPPDSSRFNQPGYEQAQQSNGDLQVCPVCWVDPKNMAFNCGHQTCQSCGDILATCPICRVEIRSKLRLY